MSRRRTVAANRRKPRLRPRALILETLETRALLTGYLSVTASDFTATAGVPVTTTVAHVTDTDPYASVPNQEEPFWVVVTIDWGDGSETNVPTGPGIDIPVAGTHTYQSPGTYTISVNAWDADLNAADGARGTATVNSPGVDIGTVTLTGQDFNATVWQAFSGTIGTVSATNQSMIPVTIDWGDGSSTEEDVSGLVFNNVVDILGSHTYDWPGVYTVTLSVPGGFYGQVTATGHAHVTQPSTIPDLAVTAQDVTGGAGLPITGSVGSVTDPGASTVYVTIDWGDGSPDTQEQVDGGTSVLIHGYHAYASIGTYQIRVLAFDASGNWGTATSTAIVSPPLSMAAQNITAIAGQAFTGNLGTVTDASADWVSVLVQWGDGASDWVDVSGGTAVPINDTHTYSAAGTYIVMVSAIDSNGTTGSATGIATVASSTTGAGLTVAAQDVSATAGQQFSGVVGTVSDPSASWVSVTVNWGDGASDSLLPAVGTAVPINDRHTYATAGTYTITVTATDSSWKSQSATSTATVAGATASGLSVTAQNISATAGQPFSGAVGTITDPYASSVAVTMNWGDGSFSSVNLSGGTGVAVNGSHTYATAGAYTVTLTASDSGGNTGSATGTATVANSTTGAGLTVTAQDISATAGQQFSGVVGTVTDVVASWVSVTVNWGDGTSDSLLPAVGTAVPINDHHTYSTAGTYTITITATDSSWKSQSATATATVAGSTVVTSSGLTATAQNISAIAGQQFSGVVGTVTDVIASWVSVNWGDGSSSSVNVSGGTSVAVNASHTYADPGVYTVTLNASDSSGNWGSASGRAIVNDSAMDMGPTVSAQNITATAGKSFSGAVGTVTDPTASWVWITIDWGDGLSENELVGGGAEITIVGRHTYASSGTFALTLSATDSNGFPGSATASADVAEADPIALDDTYTVGHDRTLTVSTAPFGLRGVLANDTDGNNATLTASLVTNVQHGALLLHADGTFTYTPQAGFSGTDTFTYQASDGALESNVATVTINVAETAPVAVADAFTVAHNHTLTVSASPAGASGVLANDTDAEGDALTASLVSTVQHGALTLHPDGTFTYTPATGFVGADSFTYRASDGTLTSNVMTVAIDVTEQAPAARPDIYTVAQGRTLTVSPSAFGASGVLFNDTDADGDQLTAALVTGVQHGTLTLNADGTFTYTPAGGFIGTDSFTYQASDGLLQSSVATVTIDVTADVPVARADAYAVNHDRALTVHGRGVLTNDNNPAGGTLTAALVTGVQHGTLVLNADGTFTYTPATAFVGTDSFTYQASNGAQASAAATVTLTVVNTAPVAHNEIVHAVPNQTLTVTTGGVLANDTDAEGDALTASLVSTVLHGTLTLNADGTYTYTPTSGYSGTDTFTYQASDGLLASNIATLTFNVVETVPIVLDDQYGVDPGKTLAVTTGGVLANDTDSEGDPLTAALVSDAQHGTLTLRPDGTFVYTPDAGFSGVDYFTYQASDGLLTSATATVSIDVSVQGPSAADDTYTVAPTQTLTATAALGVLANDTDQDGNPLTSVLVTNVQHGALTLQPSGAFSYTPAAGFIGTDTFTYQASDGTLTSNTATVTITVADQASVAQNDSYSVAAGQALLTPLSQGVQANDSSPAGSSLTSVLVSNVQHGTLALQPSGLFSYTPATGFTGTDTFTYRDTDGALSSNVATVTITVAAGTTDGLLSSGGSGGGDIPPTDSPTLSAIFGATSGTPSAGIPGLTPYAASAFGMGPATRSDSGSPSTTGIATGGVGGGGASLGGGTTFGAGFAGLPAVSGSISDFFGPGFHGNGSLVTDANGSLFHGIGATSGSLVGPPSLARDGTDMPAPFMSPIPDYGSNSNDLATTVGWLGGHWGLAGGSQGWVPDAAWWFGGTGWSRSWSGSTSINTISWTETVGNYEYSYQYNVTVDYDYKIGLNEYSGSGTASYSWTEAFYGKSWSYDESWDYSNEEEAITHASTSTATGWTETDSTFNTSQSSSYSDSGGGPAGYDVFDWPFVFVHSDWSNGSGHWEDSSSEDVYETGETSTSLGDTSFTSSLSNTEESSNSASSQIEPDSRSDSYSHNDTGSNWSSYHSEGSDSFHHDFGSGSLSDHGVESTTQDWTVSSEYSDDTDWSSEPSSDTSSHSHSDSGSYESTSHGEGTVTYGLSSSPSDEDLAAGTALETFLETSGTETFSADRGASGTFGHETLSEAESDSDGGSSATSSAEHDDGGSRYADSLVQGDVSFSAMTLDPSSGDMSTDDGSEDYTQSYDATVDYSDSTLFTSDLDTGTTTTTSHSDSGGDDASVDIGGNDTFGALTTTANSSYGETDTDSGSEDFTRGLASSDTFSNTRVIVNSDDGDGHTSTLASLEHTDDGSAEGAYGLEGSDILFTVSADRSTGEIDATQKVDDYEQGAASSVSFDNLETTDSDNEDGAVTVTTTVSHADSGSDASFSATPSEKTDVSLRFDPNTGDQSASSSTDSRIDMSSSTLQYADQDESITFRTGTHSSTTADSSHTDMGSDDSSSSDSGSDSTWDFFAHGDSDSDSADYSAQSASSDQYEDQSSASMTVTDSETITESTSSTSTSSAGGDTSSGGDTSWANTPDGSQPDVAVTSTSHQYNYDNHDHSQVHSSLTKSDGEVDSFTSMTDGGSYDESAIDWSSVNESDTHPDESGNLMTAVSVTTQLTQSHHKDHYNNGSFVTQTMLDGTAVVATSLTSGSDEGSDTASTFEQESQTPWGTNTAGVPTRSATKHETTTDQFSDSYDDGVFSLDGTIVLATSNTTHIDSRFDSASQHEHHTETVATDTGTTDHDVTSDDNLINRANNLTVNYLEDDGGVLNGWNNTTQSSTETDTVTSLDVGSFWDSVSSDFGIEQFTGTFNEFSSLTRSDLNWSSASFDFNDGVSTGLTASNLVENITQTASETTQGSDSFSQIGAGSFTYTGTGTFSETETDWISSTSQDMTGYSYDAWGNQSGGEQWTDVSEEIQTDSRHDVDHLTDQNGSSGVVTLDASDTATQWSDGSDQTGTTLSRTQTWTRTDDDGQSSYTETDGDTTTDVFADPTAAPTSTETPTSTQAGTETNPFVAARIIASALANQDTSSTSSGSETSSSSTSQTGGSFQSMMLNAGPMTNGATTSNGAIGSTSILYNGHYARLKMDYLGKGQYAIYYIDLGVFYDGHAAYVGNLDSNTGLVSRANKTVPLQAITDELTGNGWDEQSIGNWFITYTGTHVEANSLIGFVQTLWDQFESLLDIFPEMTDAEKEASLDFVSTVLTVIGIFDPTPTADGLDLALSVYRRELWGTITSSLGMIPYLGDASKLPIIGKKIGNAQKAVTTLLTGKAGKLAPLFDNMAKGACAFLRDYIQPLTKNVPDCVKKPLDDFIETIRNLLGGCFAAGTSLLVPGGTKFIEDFQEGDYVLASPEGDPEAAPAPRRVEKVFSNYMPILELHFGSAVIRTTNEHPFWVQGRGWTPANLLIEGDRLHSHDGSAVVLTGIVPTAESAPVYNMRIEEYHTFYVGDPRWGFSVWSHNTDYDPAKKLVPNAPSNVFGGLVSELDLPKDAQRALLREAMGTLGTGKVAHHLIPLEAITKFKDLMQKAARGGFNINGKNNGIALLNDIEHFAGHPGYNQIVLEELGRIRSLANSAKLTDKEVADLVQGAADTLRKAINGTNFKPVF